MKNLTIETENGSIDFINTEDGGLEINSYTHGNDNAYINLDKTDVCKLRDYLNKMNQ